MASTGSPARPTPTATSSSDHEPTRRRPARRAAGPSLLGRAVRGVAAQAQRRIPRADLDERDPDFIRERLPLMWLVASLWYRGEVRGLGNIPDSRPGAAGRQPLRRQHDPGHGRVHARLQHLLRRRAALLPARPQPGAVDARASARCGEFGTVAASPRTRARRLSRGAALLVYPGGDYEVHRPIWERNRVDFDGRKGSSAWRCSRTCRSFPVVSIGGQETALFLTPRRASGPAAGPRPALPPQGPADLAGRAVGPERRRHARPHPAAGQDHRRDAATHRPARPSSGPSPTSTRSMTT